MNKALEDMVKRVRESPAAFYRERWGSAKNFEDLPPVGREDFINSTLLERRYKDDKSLVKIVRGGGKPFLSEWSFDDIGREPWGVSSKRPMVYMSDPHEAIEKAVWCYEQGVVPLLCELDPDIAAAAAEKYRVDSLITDAPALKRLKPYLQSRDEPLESVSVLGDSFDAVALKPFAQYARQVRLVLCVPEAGAVAEAVLSESPRFERVEGCFVEKQGEDYIITKTASLVTPIIKYRAALAADIV